MSPNVGAVGGAGIESPSLGAPNPRGGDAEPGREWEDESFSGGAAGSTQMEQEILPGGLHMSDELLRLE